VMADEGGVPVRMLIVETLYPLSVSSARFYYQLIDVRKRTESRVAARRGETLFFLSDPSDLYSLAYSSASSLIVKFYYQ